MTGYEMHREENEACRERYELASERLRELSLELEQELSDGLMRDYFRWAVAYANGLVEIMDMQEQGTYLQQSEEALKEWNVRLYRDYQPEHYGSSWLDPAYAVSRAGEELGHIMSAAAWELADSAVTYTFRGNRYLLTIFLELILQLYHMAAEQVPVREWEEVWYYFLSDYQEDRKLEAYRHAYDPAYAAENRLLMETDPDDPRTLYGYGLYVSENEYQTNAFLKEKKEEEVEAMAFTYTNGFYERLQADKIDLSKKSTVQVRYPVGFERVARAVVRRFREKGLEATYIVSSTSANQQAAFDHRYDEALVLDQDYAEISRDTVRYALESIRETAAGFVGPAVIGTAREVPFEPVKKMEVPGLSEKQRKLSVNLSREIGALVKEYMPLAESIHK